MEDIVSVSEPVREISPQPPVARFFGHLISVIFHPLFIATYVTAYLLFIHPYVFAGMERLPKLLKLIFVILNTLLMPGASVLLMWRLKLIPSLQMNTSRDRLIPYVAAIIFYFWPWYVASRQPENPEVFVNFLQGAFFGVCAAWMININSKVSMHTTAAGGLVAFMLLFSFNDENASGLFLSMALLIAGLIGTARFLVSNHSNREIIQGYIIGALAMVVAWMI